MPDSQTLNKKHDPHGAPVAIMDFIQEWMKCSREEVRRWLLQKRVYLRRRLCVDAQVRVQPGDHVEIHLRRGSLDPKGSSRSARTKNSWEAGSIPVVFQDRWLLVVQKPHGLPTQPTVDRQRANLFDLLKAQHPYLALHHRLDADTSGLVLMVMDPEANRGVAELFTQHQIEKTYVAICDAQSPTSEGAELLRSGTQRVDNYLARDRERRVHGKRATWMRSVRSGGDRAVTDLRVLGRRGGVAWIEARPLTGRTHQIRVHLSEMGLPVMGDRVYGHGNVPTGWLQDAEDRLYLHAVKLTFRHPMTGVAMEIVSPESIPTIPSMPK